MEEHRLPAGTGLSSGGSAMVMLNNGNSPGKLASMTNNYDGNGQLGGGQALSGGFNKSSAPQYTMAGILQFLQTEWAKFEIQKANWDMERAELQARIAFLDGERRAQENLKRDLVRRIKMLEYALKQERSKFYKLRYGVDVDFTQPQPSRKPDAPSAPPANSSSQHAVTTENGGLSNIAQARQVLRAYLREVGYTDSILDVRNVRVRQLLGLQQSSATQVVSSASESDRGNNARGANPAQSTANRSGGDARLSQGGGFRAGKSSNSGSRDGSRIDETGAPVISSSGSMKSSAPGHGNMPAGSLGDASVARPDAESLIHTQRDFFEGAGDATFGDDLMGGGDADEQEVLAEFDYLVNEESESGQSLDSLKLADESDDAEVPVDTDQSVGAADMWHVDQNKLQSMKDAYVKGRKNKARVGPGMQHMLADLAGESASDGPADFLSAEVDELGAPQRRDLDDQDLDEDLKLRSGGTGAFHPPADRTDELITGDQQLGELAELNVVPGSGDDETADLVSGVLRREARSWSLKYTLRSHFDGVRSVAFHPYDAAMFTASEDGSVKFWSLQRPSPKKAAALDIEPVYTFRAHTAPVLSVVTNQAGTNAYSAGVDSTIRVWHVPSVLADQYDSYDPSVLVDTLVGHTDAVWSLAVHPTQPHLLSASADGSVRLWSVGGQATPVNTYRLFGDDVPTSVSYLQTDPTQCLVATRNGDCYVIDIERGAVVTRLEPTDDTELLGDHVTTAYGRFAYRVVSQSTSSSCVCAYEDRTIRFFDVSSGKQTHAMVAHLDAVTSLAIDPSGLFLLSASHDSSLRIWAMATHTCMQEITAHRKKFAESIHDVAVHQHKPLFASAGADALAKVFLA